MINGELIVDNFAGGGGASTGIEMATGISVDIAINHDPEAIRMHKMNHPSTKHYCESVWDVEPIEACNGHPVGLAWFSPDCKHFSKAKGGKPKDKNIRGLAWVALRWAGKVRPRVIMLENVEEFKTWGPLNRSHRPIKKKQGDTFRKFVSQLEELGYVVEYRELVAADYGAPTMRKRFFLIARCDGKPIIWPEPTHGPIDSEEVKTGLLQPYVGAYTQLDFSLPCPSIFDTAEEIKEKYGIRAVRPLAPKTMERIARGLKKFVIDNAEPFIVQVNHSGAKSDYCNSMNEPLRVVTAILDGRKRVTRRLVKPQQIIGLGCDKCPNNMPEEYIKQKKMLFKPWCDMSDNELISAIYKSPYQQGDILYVRETWTNDKLIFGKHVVSNYHYKADGNMQVFDSMGREVDFKWRPSIHMPKEAARIFLRVKDVRVERLQDITEEQTEAAGFQFTPPCLSRVSEDSYCDLDGPCTSKVKYCDMSAGELFGKVLWNSTIKKSDLEQYGWDANPWVWVIEFERVEVDV